LAQELARWPERGRWPASVAEIPLFLTPRYLAHLLNRSERTLERDRHMGRSIPYRKVGRTVLYARDDVLEFLRQSPTSACASKHRLQRSTANRESNSTEQAP
jgi:hypothetical protein